MPVCKLLLFIGFVTDCVQKFVGLLRSIEGEAKKFGRQSVTNLINVLFCRGQMSCIIIYLKEIQFN